MKPTVEQENLIIRAGLLIKEAFPKQNLRFSFNLSEKHNNTNFNLEGDWKISGIVSPKPKK